VSQHTSSGFSETSPYVKALSLSVILHIILLAGLILGDFSTLPKPKPNAAKKSGEPIKAVVVDKAKLEQAVNKIKQQKKSTVECRKKAY
jgi:colicin import membrane protein